ncbi:MAG: hypothetical protein WC574_01410 [Candidatus Omnitrophota bacterium]
MSPASDPVRNDSFLTISIADIKIRFEALNSRLLKSLKVHYGGFCISSAISDVAIRLIERKISVPKGSALLYKNRTWSVVKDSKYKWIIFSDNSVACCSHDWSRVDFFSEGPRQQLLFFLLPEILTISALPKFKGLMAHGCGVLDRTGKQGWAFLASSGGGKSTMAGLLKPYVRVLNDDRIILRKTKDGVRMYGTPWHGELSLTSSKSVLIRDIYFLQKAGIHSINSMSKLIFLKGLLKNTALPKWDNNAYRITLRLLFFLAEYMCGKKLHFAKNSSVYGYIKRELT